MVSPALTGIVSVRLKKLLPSELSVTFSFKNVLTWKFLLLAVGVNLTDADSPLMIKV